LAFSTNHLDLAADVVDLWKTWLDLPTDKCANFFQTLSDDERERAERFHFPKDRGRFVVGRGFLRALLARYVDVPPGEVCFRYGRCGKPELAVAEQLGIQFNVSHSHGLAVYALTRQRAVGIDVECIRHIPDMELLAERFFAVPEVTALRSVAREKLAEAFFNCWTRKEATVKACGDGLTLPLDSFTVSLAPGEPARLLSAGPTSLGASRWQLEGLTLAPGYVGAIAVEGTGWQAIDRSAEPFS